MSSTVKRILWGLAFAVLVWYAWRLFFASRVV